MRVYHSGRDPQHRGRERELAALGHEVNLVVPTVWPDSAAENSLSPEPFRIYERRVHRAGHVNRHAYRDMEEIKRLISTVQPDILDIHEEPMSVAAHQWLGISASSIPVVMYTAQNIYKRYPPPYSTYERSAFQRVDAFYPCSSQAAAVVRGKGFAGTIDVLPLGYDDEVFQPGGQTLSSNEIVLALAGRLVAEKGIADAVRVLAKVNAVRPSRLVLIGSGAEEGHARDLAKSLGVVDRLEILPWLTGPDLASIYASAHIVLVPSLPTQRWVEQFGRVIVEAQASGAVVAGYASGAIPEVAGAAAMIVPIGDVERLAASVVEVVSDAVEFAQRRRAGILQAALCTWHAIAIRQVELFQTVAAGEAIPLELPRSPRLRREAALAEFGGTAVPLGGERPFALPLLRNGGSLSRTLGALMDASAEHRSRLPYRR